MCSSLSRIIPWRSEIQPSLLASPPRLASRQSCCSWILDLLTLSLPNLTLIFSLLSNTHSLWGFCCTFCFFFLESWLTGVVVGSVGHLSYQQPFIEQILKDVLGITITKWTYTNYSDIPSNKRQAGPEAELNIELANCTDREAVSDLFAAILADMLPQAGAQVNINPECTTADVTARTLRLRPLLVREDFLQICFLLSSLILCLWCSSWWKLGQSCWNRCWICTWSCICLSCAYCTLCLLRKEKPITSYVLPHPLDSHFPFPHPSNRNQTGLLTPGL